MLYTRLVVCLAAAASVSGFTLTKLKPKSSDYDNFVYLIRHGEKPADGSNGLSPQGEERAQCLVNVRFHTPLSRTISPCLYSLGLQGVLRIQHWSHHG